MWCWWRQSPENNCLCESVECVALLKRSEAGCYQPLKLLQMQARQEQPRGCILLSRGFCRESPSHSTYSGALSEAVQAATSHTLITARLGAVYRALGRAQDCAWSGHMGMVQLGVER